MSKYFDEDGNEVTLESLQTGAEISNMELEQYIKEFGFTVEGKQNGPTEKTPPVGPQPTPAGDSSSGDISLESPEINPVQKALKRLGQINISDEYKALEEAVDTPTINQVMSETTSGIMMPTGQTYETYVYDDYIETAKSQLGSKATEEEIAEKAKNLYLTAAKSDLFNAKVEEIMEDFDDEIYTPFGRLKKYMTKAFAGADLSEGAKQKALLQKEIEKSRQNAIAEIDRLAKNKIAEEAYLETSAIKLNKIGKKYEKDPATVSQQEIDEYKKLSEEYQEVYSSYTKTNEELTKTIETGQNLEELVDLTARSYDNLDIAAGRVASAALNMSGNLLNFVREVSPDKIVSRVTGEEASDYTPFYIPGVGVSVNPELISAAGDALVKEAENITGKIEKRQELSKVKSVEDFLEFGLDLFTEQAVNTAVTASIPAAGLMAVAASASGEKFRTMQIEMDNGEEITPLQFYVTGLMYGAGEYVTEKVALDQFLGAKRSIKKSFNLSKTNISQSPTTTLKALEKWGTGINVEGRAELGSQLISNFADRYVLDRKEVGIWDGIGEAYFSGAVMSGLGFGAPGLITDIYSAATTGNEAAAANRRSARVIEITNKINDLHANYDINDPQVQQAVGVLQEEADGLIKENLASMKAAEARVDELSKEDKRILLNIDGDIYKAKGAVDRINNNDNLSKEEKVRLIEKHIDRINSLENRKEDIFANSEASKGKAKAKAFQMRTAAEKGLAFNYINGKDTDDAVAQALIEIENADIVEEDKAKLKEELLKVKESANKGEADIYGFYAGAEFGFPIAITTDVGARKNRSVAAHEIAHATLFKKLLEGNTDIIGLAQDLRSYLEKTYGDIAINKFKKVDLNYGKIEVAPKEGKADIAEEIMAAAVELSRRFDLKTNANKTLQGKLLGRWNSIFKNETDPTEIKTGKDVLAAIESFNASFDTGEIKGLTAKILKGEVKARLADFKQRAEDRGVVLSVSGAAARAQATLEKMQEEGYDPNNFELYETLNGMVGAQLNKYKVKGLQIIDMEEAVADVVGRLYTERDVNKFDGRGTLYGYLNGRIKFRILDAFKTKPIWVEDFGDIDAEGLTGKEVQKVAVEAVEPAVPVVEKPKYKSLMQRKVLSEQTLETVKKKVLSVTRVLKSRIDAPVSKNVTVTPLAAEIKKAVGKQLDIDFKKEMGGIKDGALRKYLLKNKGAILENMTTTWLMTAMPNAVQKQVGGVWTSDWKGKKIDRETVSTDRAGRTSGAELVRRLPNASTRLSDADFLSNFFTEDGKLIRGRKESLAKAMAEETGFEIIREELKNENSEIAKAFINSQERAGVEDTGNMRAKYEIMAERGNVKFSKSTIKIAEGNTTPVRTELDLELAGRNKTDSLLKENKFAGVYRFKNEGDVDTFIADVKSGLLKTMPRNFFFPTDKGGPLTYSSKIIGASSKDAVWKYYVAEINKLRKLPNSAFGKPVQGVSNFNPPSYKTLFKNEATVLKNKANGKIEAFNKQVGAMHSAMWFRFNEAIQENRENARVIAQFLNFSTSNPKHPNRLGAQFVGYSKGFTEGKSNVTFEHAMPNLAAYLYLLDASLNGGNFDLAYKLVMANYKLIALDKKSDEKLGGVYKTGMPKGWSVINGNWAQRYFNPLVFENDGGIDPESIIMLDGRTLGETAGIKADGTLLSEKSIKFSKSINQEQLQKDKANIADESSVVENDTTGLSDKFNKIVERKTGVDAVKTFSRIQAQLRGKRMGRFKFFIAPSADDFRGLVHYAFAGKGKQGEADMAFFEEKLLTPYFKGIAAIDAMRQQIKREFRTVTKQFKEEYKMLSQQVADSGFTYDHALRVYMWNRQGTPVEGLSKRDTKLLLDAITKNPELVSLADALLVVARRDAWPDPSEYWEGNSVLADLNSMTEKIGRKKFLEEFIQNADAIFTEDNMNKIEALYGRAHKEAIEDSLYAMKNGTNRPSGANRQVNAWLNWINGSTGAIMFFNRRSALLQMLSFTNFINWSDNNPVKAAAAFANQKQYWKDFAMIFNSDKLKERRGGLKQDVSDSEIADVAGRSKNSPQAVLAYLLKIGFTPTQIADSMAIATGGAMFYRNRVNTYLNQGMDQAAAEGQAFLDFSKKSDEAQQSSDPALVSQQQRSVLGRLILAFANTPMQYTRLMKKAGQDLINGRGDWRENVSKIAYYGVVQNFIFSALQSALFALVFDDDEEDEEKAKATAEKKKIRVINSMLDTVLRGSGIYGAVAATIKNAIVEYFNQEKKGFLSDHTYTVLAAAGISPPIQSKLRKIYSAIQTKKFEADNVAARGWALTADGKLNLGPNYSILGNVLSGVTNVPMDRVVDELRSISEALDARNKAWQRIALALGWKTWDVGVRNEEADLIKAEAKELRKKEGIEKAKKTREETRRKKTGTREDRKRRARQRRK